MKILVAGAGGFVGSCVCRQLADSGHEVIALYRSTKPNAQNIQTYRLDLKNKVEIEEQADAVINFASQMKGSRINDYLDNTVLPMKNLLEYAQKAGAKTFIEISSIAVYGETNGIVDENSDRMNVQDYGLSKQIAERMLEDADLKNRYVLRLPRVLGPGIDFTYPWLPRLSWQLLNNEVVYYFRPNLLYNNLMYIDSLSAFLQKLLGREEEEYQMVVLGSSNPVPVIEIIHTLKEELGSSSALIEKIYKGRNTCHLIDSGKAVTMGYQPIETIEVLKRFASVIRNGSALRNLRNYSQQGDVL